MNNPILELKDLAIGYGGTALYRNLNLTIGEGELVALLGANGAGKSTLLNAITGRLAPLDGRVAVLGKAVNKLTSKELSQLVSVVTTDRNVAGGLTVAELVGLGRQPYTGFFGRLSDKDKKIVGEALRAVGMESFASRDMASLSDGERQKVMIARALAQDTPLILLDEPTSFLDVASRLETFQLLSELAHNQKKTILVTTHDVATAIRLADILWLMSEDVDGCRRIVSGAPADLINNGALETLFQGRRVRFDRQVGDFLPK